MTALTQTDIFRPKTQTRALLYDAALILGASAFIALMAHLTVYLPFSPVPITGQTLAILLVGALLGSSRGSVAVLAYLAEGASGMPVFAGGHAGAIVLAGPTGGYLLGFVIAAYAVGWLAERGWDRNIALTAVAMLLGNVLIYFSGLTWLAQFVGTQNTLAAGLYPFIIGDITKIAIAALLLPAAWKLLANKQS